MFQEVIIEPSDEYEALERIILNALKRTDDNPVRAMTLLASAAYKIRNAEYLNRRIRMQHTASGEPFEPPPTDPTALAVRMLGEIYGNEHDNEVWYASWNQKDSTLVSQT